MLYAVFQRLETVDLHMTVMSGLNHTAYSLAVYASPQQLPGCNARLATGRLPAFAGWGYPHCTPNTISRWAFNTHPSQVTKLAWRTKTRPRYLSFTYLECPMSSKHFQFLLENANLSLSLDNNPLMQ